MIITTLTSLKSNSIERVEIDYLFKVQWWFQNDKISYHISSENKCSRIARLSARCQSFFCIQSATFICRAAVFIRMPISCTLFYLSNKSEAKICCWYLQEATAAAIKAAELAAAIDGDLVIKGVTRKRAGKKNQQKNKFTRRKSRQIKGRRGKGTRGGGAIKKH